MKQLGRYNLLLIRAKESGVLENLHFILTSFLKDGRKKVGGLPTEINAFSTDTVEEKKGQKILDFTMACCDNN